MNFKNNSYNPYLFFALLISIGVNAILIGFVLAGVQALRHPAEAIRDRVGAAIQQLPAAYQPAAQAQFDKFTQQSLPLLSRIRDDRKSFAQVLLASPVDIKKAQAQADEIQHLTTQLQENMQSTLISVAAALPPEEKAKLVAKNRVLQRMVQQ